MGNLKMKQILTILLLTLFSLPLSFPAFAEPTVQEILKIIDENQNHKNQIITYSMTINGKRGTRTIRAKAWTEGRQKSFTTYLAPARDKGVKMLKVKDRLWSYYPKADRIIAISGHMLRRSVMGSDFSFEDMSENRTLEDLYSVTKEPDEDFKGKKVWVLLLKAKTPDIAYQSQKLWVEKDRNVVLKQELYASSGKLLKKAESLEFMKIEDGWYIKRILFKDMLKSGKGTEMTVEEVRFVKSFPKNRFVKSRLRR